MKKQLSGGYSCRETPVPISNTEVKSAAPMILVWRRTGKAGTASSNLKGLEFFDIFKTFFV